ncbi:MAG: hypothetical protein C0594_15140 [Marinilabiliales bacterium]|nr:MAG: hypothetical protein C0594_15140 [Marinilabiliales bacterium]
MKSNYKRSKIKFSDLYYKDADTSARKSAYKSKNTLNFSSLDLIDGYYYFRNEKFSGKAEIYYNNGVLKALLSFRNGIKNGLSTYWYSNGVKQKESFFENGVLDGF